MRQTALLGLLVLMMAALVSCGPAASDSGEDSKGTPSVDGPASKEPPADRAADARLNAIKDLLKKTPVTDASKEGMWWARVMVEETRAQSERPMAFAMDRTRRFGLEGSQIKQLVHVSDFMRTDYRGGPDGHFILARGRFATGPIDAALKKDGFEVERPIGEFALYGRGEGHKRAWIALRENQLVFGHEDMVRAAVALEQGDASGGKQSVFDFEGVPPALVHVALLGPLLITRMPRSLLGKPTEQKDTEISVSATESVEDGKNTNWLAIAFSSEEAATETLKELEKPQPPRDPRMTPLPTILSREQRGRVLLLKTEEAAKRR